MPEKKVHYSPRCIDPYPLCGVYKNRDLRSCMTQDQTKVTCKACLKKDMDAALDMANICDIFNITKGL